MIVLGIRLAAITFAVSACDVIRTDRGGQADSAAPLAGVQPPPPDTLAPPPAASLVAEPDRAHVALPAGDTIPIVASSAELAALARELIIPVEGVRPGELRDTYEESRGTRPHDAIDIHAPRGTPVLSAADGRLLKLHNSVPGGLMVYAADASDRFILLYGHLDAYASGLTEGMTLRQGQLLGYVGTTGNAPPDTPHLHFAVLRGRPSVSWSRGTAVNPYPLLTQRLAGTPRRPSSRQASRRIAQYQCQTGGAFAKAPAAIHTQPVQLDTGGYMILVAGATGVLGSEIVRRLVDRRQRVRALVRPTSAPDKVAALEKMGVEIARGDLSDRASLDAACRNVERVVSTISAIATAKPGESFQSTDSEGTTRLIDAAAAAGVKHFVFVSFDTAGMPEAPLRAAKAGVENHLKRSGLTYTILQPSLFMETWLGPMLFADPAAGTARIYGSGQHKVGYVAAADVAEVAAQSLTSPATTSTTIAFGGPEQITQREAVEIFTRAFGKEFAVTEIPEEALRAQWESAADPFQKTFSALMLGLAEGWGAAPPPDPTAFPMKMTSVAEFAADRARSASAGR